MVAEVNKLISNTLVQGRDIFLPSVGTLVVRKNAASRASSTKMAPPCRTVTFTGEQRGESIIALIGSKAGVDNARAEEIYQQWLEQTRKDDVVTIEGVGVIAERKFTEDKALTALLNPAMKSVVLKPRRNWKPYLIVALLLLIVAVVLALLLCCKDEPAVEVVEQPVVEQVVEPQPEPEPVAVKDPDVEDMTPGASYAVWGVFAEKSNALKYKNLLARKYGHKITPVIYNYKDNTMYLLAIAEKSTRYQCQDTIYRMQELDGLFDGMWVYTYK